VNALNAAALAILGMHANRERFHEEDKIKVHPIITKGGDVVNSVPDNVVMDCYVRGATMEAIKNASADTDRAVMGAAQMVGAQAEIHTEMGYLPFCRDGGGYLYRCSLYGAESGYPGT
jgi:metal-dependent amidase/aminoacylase/carboxypeptidase family protein